LKFYGIIVILKKPRRNGSIERNGFETFIDQRCVEYNGVWIIVSLIPTVDLKYRPFALTISPHAVDWGLALAVNVGVEDSGAGAAHDTAQIQSRSNKKNEMFIIFRSLKDDGTRVVTDLSTSKMEKKKIEKSSTINYLQEPL
jgi:hypothetical protein